MDDSTTDEKDGFSEGEPLHFRVWSQDFICEYSDAINAVYSEQDFFFTSDDGLFASNGISGLMGFDVANLTVSETHSDYTGFGVSCNGAIDGFIDLTVTGGTAPYSYVWSNGATTEDISDLGAGTYSVVVTDINDCSVSMEVVIIESEAMAISESHSDYTGFGVSCNGATDGSIDVTVTGGTGNYTYVWSNGATTEDLSELGAGTYSVVATDDNGCSVSIEVDITESEAMDITATNSDYTGFGVSGSGATDGSIDITVTGGTGNYTYTWSNGATTEDLSDIGAGTYSVVVTDENGCSVSIEVEITEPVGMEISESHSDYTGFGVSCNGATDGSIDVTVTGGTGNYTYTWSNGATTEDLSDLGAGTYSVVATDENGNTVSISVEITESEAMAISSLASDYSGFGVSCNGATDGSIDITVTGGTGNYTYEWSNGASTEDVSDLGAGTYSVVVTDDNGCLISASVEITESEAMAISSVASDYNGFGVSCNGAMDGFIDVSVSGGTGNYSYAWTQAGGMPVLWPESNDPLDLNNGLGTGGNATMMINFTPDGIEAGDMIGVFYVGDGDTGPIDAYTCAGFVVWDDSMPPTAITILGNVNNAFGMEEGSPLTMFMYDSSADETFSVSNSWQEAGVLGMSDAAAGYTNNGLFQSLGMTFNPTGNVVGTDEDLSAIGAGTYSVTVTDENGCSISTTVEITESDAMAISSVVSDYTGFGVSCNGATDGSIDVTVTGGTGTYSYVWSADSETPVIWPDSNDPLDLNNGLGTGGNATMMINYTPEGIESGDLLGIFYIGDGDTGPEGAYTCAGIVVWDDSMPPSAITILGNVNNAFGMEEGSPLTMFMYDSSEGTTYSVTNTWQEAGVLGMSDATAGYTNNGLFQSLDMTFESYSSGTIATTEDVSNLSAGTYTVVATDENGCSITTTVEITESDEMTISSVASDYNGFGVSCNGATDGSIDVTVTGGTGNYTYSWSNGASESGEGGSTGFTGMFAPEQWTIYNGDGNGFVTFSDEGNSVLIMGSDTDDSANNWGGSVGGNLEANGLNSPTEMYMTVDSDVTISFDWLAETEDGWPYEIAYYINGVSIPLTDSIHGMILILDPRRPYEYGSVRFCYFFSKCW